MKKLQELVFLIGPQPCVKPSPPTGRMIETTMADKGHQLDRRNDDGLVL